MCIYMHVYIYIHIYTYMYICLVRLAADLAGGSTCLWRCWELAFTRYSFTSKRLCTNPSSFYRLPPRAMPTLLQYDCATIAQYMTPIRPPLCMPYTIQYWQWQYRVKAKLGAVASPCPCVVCGFVLCEDSDESTEIESPHIEPIITQYSHSY